MDQSEAEARDGADMQRLAEGHDAALNDLMERHAERVFRFLSRRLANVEDAQDLAQETFVRVYSARRHFRPQERFSAWLYTIAANLARNRLRWRARHPQLSLDAPPEQTHPAPPRDSLVSGDAHPDDALLAEERIAAVRQAVQGLPDDLREAIVLCEWEQLAVAEAAGVLRTTPKAVEARLYRARRLLRERLHRWV